jgi:hypothetical protein
MTFEPLLPSWLAALAALLAVGAAVLCYRRPSVPAALRVAALAILALMLANPVAETVRPGKPRRSEIAIAIDTSGSMATADGDGGVSRYAEARALAERLRGQLITDCDVTIMGLGADGLSSGLPNAPAGDTDYGALASLTGGKRQAAVVIGDGADWSGSSPETVLAKAGLPVHAVAVGSPRLVDNAAISLRPSSPSAEPAQELTLTASVTASPGLRGRRARLVVREGPATAASASAAPTLATRELVLAEHTAIEFGIAPLGVVGARVWRADLTLDAVEATTEDNSAWASVAVVDRSRRIGLLEGRAWWDTAFAVRAWRRDRQWSLSVLHRLGKLNRPSGDLDISSLDAKTLAQLDVLVLGSGIDRMVDAATATRIAAFVDHGGGLLLLAPGPTGVAAIDACTGITWGAADVAATATADDMRLPGLLPAKASIPVRSRAITTLPPQCHLLLGSREQPLVVRHRVGAGWVCQVAMDGVWRWQLGGAGGAGDDAGERFWRQLLRGIVQSDQGALRPERAEVTIGGEVAVWNKADSDEPVRFTDPAGATSIVTPTGGCVRLAANRAGLYRFDQGGSAAVVVCRPRIREQIECGRDDARLMRLAKATGGLCVDAAGLDRIAERIRAVATAEQRGAEERRTRPLITTPWWLAAVAGLLSIEWWWRRRRLGAA